MTEMTAEGGSWLTRALVDGGAVRLVVVEAAELAEEVRTAHRLDPIATRLAAEASIATLLLSAYAKGEEKLTLQMAFSGLDCRFLGELDPQRRFRARLWTASDLPADLDLHRLNGVLQAAKYVGTREVYRGITGIDRTSVTGALRGHLVDSTQVSGALATQVTLADDGSVLRAAGILAERLPEEGDQPCLTPAEFHARWGALDTDDVEPLIDAVRARTVHGESVHVLQVLPAFWSCTCSRERVVAALAGLGPQELITMADEDGGAAIDCEFCRTRYALSADELRAMAAGAAD